MNAMNKLIIIIAVATLQFGMGAATAQSIHVDADQRAKVSIKADAPTQHDGFFSGMWTFFETFSPSPLTSVEPAAKDPEKPSTREATDKGKPASAPALDNSKAASNLALEESTPDVICTVGAKGAGRMKALTLTIAANRPIAGMAELNASTVGRNRGRFITDAGLDLHKGESQDFVLATTNMTEGATISAGVIIKGKEYRCD